MNSSVINHVYLVIAGLCVTVPLGIIGYFLRQTMNRLKDVEDKVSGIKDAQTKAEAHKKDTDANTKAIAKLEKDIDLIKSDYLSRDEFVRSIAQINHKFDRMEDKMDRNAAKVDEKLDRLLKQKGI